MLRIIHAYKVFRPDVDGGIPEVLATLAHLDQEEGFENEIFVARSRGFFRKFILDRVQVTAVFSFGTLLSLPLAPTFPFALASRFREADVLVHHAPFPLTDFSILFGLPKRVGLIVYWHADIVGRSVFKWLLRPIFKNTLRRADKIIISNEAMLRSSPLLMPHANKCVVIPFGVDLEYWKELTETEQREVEELRRETPRLIVAVGRLVSYKGYDVLVHAMTEVDAKAIVIGSGPLQPELEKLARDLGVTDRITFAGRLPRDEIKKLIHASRVFAFPSINVAEAFGLVQLEAMAVGRPIVNTDIASAVPHIARNEREGLTVPIQNSTALASALRRLLNDAAFAERLGQAGQIRALSEYAPQKYLERIRSVFLDVSKSRKW